ncbi:hypothetical protein B0J12DRAFT_343519 [Macrophomina phaseolina]|uniref:Uncharacterized protein n=1 Tax=Macrophomina phaseolina TaxID=35725 RepID=A0ABQ8GMZ7_9PEZI|nr:hypothetical protein B0J12DRAFT_343519 [Macrophomina phaseolina]
MLHHGAASVAGDCLSRSCPRDLTFAGLPGGSPSVMAVKYGIIFSCNLCACRDTACVSLRARSLSVSLSLSLPRTSRDHLPDLRSRESGTIFALHALCEQGPKPEFRTLVSPRPEDAVSGHWAPRRHSDNTPHRQADCDQTHWPCISPFSSQARYSPAVEVLVACRKEYVGFTARAAQFPSSQRTTEDCRVTHSPAWRWPRCCHHSGGHCEVTSQRQQRNMVLSATEGGNAWGVPTLSGLHLQGHLHEVLSGFLQGCHIVQNAPRGAWLINCRQIIHGGRTSAITAVIAEKSSKVPHPCTSTLRPSHTLAGEPT